MTVYEKKSITAAAKELYISPQGLSKIIKGLEEELEVELFERTPQGMEATEQSEILYARATHLIYLINDLKKELSIIDGKKSVLNISATFNATTAVPADVLFGFSEKYNNVQMKLKEFPNETPIATLLQDEYDLAIVMGHEGHEHYTYEPIMTGRMVALVGKDHPIAGRERISLSELNGRKVVLISEEAGRQHKFVEKCMELGSEPEVVYVIDSVVTARKLCREKDYILITDSITEAANEDEKCKIIELEEEIPANIYIIKRKNDYDSKKVSMFEEYLEGTSIKTR